MCNAICNVFLLLIFLCPLALAQETNRVYCVPFHTVNGLILLDAAVNDKPAVLLLDTGADNSIVSPDAAGIKAKLDALKPEKTTGAAGDYAKTKIDLRLEKRHWIERSILVMDLSEASKQLGTRIDGFISQDILREFSAVRIDYKASFVELETYRDLNTARIESQPPVKKHPSILRLTNHLP